MESYWMRQAELVPEKIREMCVLVAGVGAIGRQVALQLATMGVGKLVLVDPETVEDVNVGLQGYAPCDVGEYKVSVLGRELCSRVPEVRGLEERVDKGFTHLGGVDVVMSCVDSMKGRKQVWAWSKEGAGAEKVELVVDGRMSGEVVRIVTANPKSGFLVRGGPEYMSTLVSDAEAYQERCTAKGTIYTANIAAGFMLGQVTKWMREFTVKGDFTVNILGGVISEGQAEVDNQKDGVA